MRLICLNHDSLLSDCETPGAKAQPFISEETHIVKEGAITQMREEDLYLFSESDEGSQREEGSLCQQRFICEPNGHLHDAAERGDLLDGLDDPF